MSYQADEEGGPMLGETETVSGGQMQQENKSSKRSFWKMGAGALALVVISYVSYARVFSGVASAPTALTATGGPPASSTSLEAFDPALPTVPLSVPPVPPTTTAPTDPLPPAPAGTEEDNSSVGASGAFAPPTPAPTIPGE